MKQYLLTSALGRAAMLARDTMSILWSALSSPEAVGTLANDLLAVKLATRLCKANTTFLDVGAHIGSFISEVRHHVPSARIIAIEAIPDKVERLKHYFPFAEIHACAAGERTGDASFFVDVVQSGYSSLAKPSPTNSGPAVEITVPVRRLDDVVLSDDVDVIKIDVEGAELGALRGSVKILETCRPTVVFESAPQDVLGFTKEALYDFLTKKNYCIVVPNRVAHDDTGLTLEGFLDSHLYPRRTTNYFAIPKERRLEIRDRARLILGIRVN